METIKQKATACQLGEMFFISGTLTRLSLEGNKAVGMWITLVWFEVQTTNLLPISRIKRWKVGITVKRIMDLCQVKSVGALEKLFVNR